MRDPGCDPILVGGVRPRAMGSSPGLKEFAGRRIVQRHQRRALQTLSSCSPGHVFSGVLSDGRRRSASMAADAWYLRYWSGMFEACYGCSNI